MLPVRPRTWAAALPAPRPAARAARATPPVVPGHPCGRAAPGHQRARALPLASPATGRALPPAAPRPAPGRAPWTARPDATRARPRSRLRRPRPRPRPRRRPTPMPPAPRCHPPLPPAPVRQHFPRIVTYASKMEPAYSFDHYAVATDAEYPNKAARVKAELWTYYRCEEGFEARAEQVTTKACKKLASDMHLEMRI
ncbi:uncharacterized protein [Miscanthus floridulus]|uniref:uncharacterized protein n=1 Tax=Miscanthus floridulus TaxID=154761 RepID=UPI00345982C4